MRSYFRLKYSLTALLLIYPVIGIASLLTPNQEIFPFYSWFLFAEVPNPANRYDIQVVGDEGKAFPAPIPYNDAAGIAIHPKTITAYQFIQKMGQAHDENNPGYFEELRRIFERNFIKSSCSYQLTRTYYDPVKKWKGEPQRVEVIQTFSGDKQSP